MKTKGWIAALCLLAGIPLAAWGLAGGGALPALLGLALVLAFWFLAWQWLSQSNKLDVSKIKPAENAAWGMKDVPVRDKKPGGDA